MLNGEKGYDVRNIDWQAIILNNDDVDRVTCAAGFGYIECNGELYDY